jgi:hypothetical protein
MTAERPRGGPTRTFAIMELSKGAYAEIAEALARAGYDQAFIEDDGRVLLDMHGIAVASKSKAQQPRAECAADYWRAYAEDLLKEPQ